ncbi:hypothetical protein RFI_36641, partial [Reticulomyxa filosa]
DQYIQQTMQISAIWDHSIDLNLIYAVLNYECNGDINSTFGLLSKFEQWKFRDNNKQKYKKKMNKFLKRRCCNHNVNSLCMFLSEKYEGPTAIASATIYTIQNDKTINKKRNIKFVKVKFTPINNIDSIIYLLSFINSNKKI